MAAPQETVRGDVPLWLTGPVPEPVRDPLPATTDLAIIGGGVAGVAVAHHAVRHGVRVVLLEAGRLAGRASGRNDGQVLLGLGEHLNRLYGQWGRERGRALWAFLADNGDAMAEVVAALGLDCHYHRDGGLRLADGPAEGRELEETSALMREDGIPHRLYGAAELEAVLPLGRGFDGGLYLEGEALFDPARFVRGLAAAARAGGLVLREDTRVASITGELGEFRLDLDDGPLRASIVVHATSALAPDLDRSGFLARTLFPLRAQILTTPPLPAELATRMPPWAMSSNFCYEYFRMHGDRLSLGGMRWSVPGEEGGTRDDGVVNPTITANLLAWLGRHFPDLAPAGAERCWTGILAGTPDGLPLIGELPGRPGELACLGFNGYGMSFAYLAGRSIAEQVAEGRATHPSASLFRPDRFRAAAGA
ncbi:MAG: FAD-binding oxidoreductase [Planctomycetota bacterium]